MNARKDLPLFVAALCAVVSVSASASAETPAPRVPTHLVAPDKKPAVAPVRPSPLQRPAAGVGLGKASAAPASKLPTHLDMRSSPTKGTAPRAAPDVAPRAIEFGGGEHIDSAVQTLMDRANATGIPHKGTFNGYELVARPGDARKTVIKPFDDAMQAGRERRAAQQSNAEKARAQRVAAFTKPLVRTPPAGMKLDSRGKVKTLSLLTPAQLKELPEGTVLRGLFSGRDVIVGIDDIDDDERGGFTAYGFDATNAGK